MPRISSYTLPWQERDPPNEGWDSPPPQTCNSIVPQDFLENRCDSSSATAQI